MHVVNMKKFKEKTINVNENKIRTAEPEPKLPGSYKKEECISHFVFVNPR